MRCPYCKADNDRVIDSRASADGFAIRRRRVCADCGRRYTTYERVETAPLRVVKKNGERVAFDRQKVLSGMIRACEKRPIALETLETIADRIERQCMEAFDKEVPSKVIGSLIMQSSATRSGGLRPIRVGLSRIQGREPVPGRTQADAREAKGGRKR